MKNPIHAIVLAAVKDKDHFLLVYPNTNVGHIKAEQAVITWLLNPDLDFNRHDAEQLWREIDTRRFSGTFDFHGEGRLPCDLPIQSISREFHALVKVLTNHEAQPESRAQL